MLLGDFVLTCVNDGFFKLDGGAMFGVVPKIVWAKKIKADKKNRIPMSLNCLLIHNKRTGDIVLVDTGIGIKAGKEKEKFEKFYDFHGSTLREKMYNKASIYPDDVNFVINTHLHLDHAGGNTYFDESKRIYKPVFRNAKYVMSAGELKSASLFNKRTAGSYLRESFGPLISGNKENSTLISHGEREIIEGVNVLRTGGHTAYHQCVKIVSGGKTALYLGDLIPTTVHLKLPWIMGYDLYPLETLRMKDELLSRAFSDNWLLIFEHDPEIAAGYLKKDGEEWKLRCVDKIN